MATPLSGCTFEYVTPQKRHAPGSEGAGLFSPYADTLRECVAPRVNVDVSGVVAPLETEQARETQEAEQAPREVVVVFLTALFESRSKAESARARLVSGVELEAIRMLAKDTAAAVDDLKLDPKVAKRCREALLRGEHLLVARVARGEDPKRIIRLLDESTSPEPDDVQVEQAYRIESGGSSRHASEATQTDAPGADSLAAGAADPIDDVIVVDDEISRPQSADPAAAMGNIAREQEATRASEARASETTPREAAAPEPRDEIRIGDGELVARDGASVGEKVSLKREHARFDKRGPERRLSDGEVEAAGLLKDRTIEVVEMREEPVVCQEVVVREELIIRKSVNQRTETVRDVVRCTKADVSELPDVENR